MDKKTKNKRLSPQAMRRLLGVKLLVEGRSTAEVMEITGASLSAVKRWKRVIREEGVEALQPKENHGRPAKLSDSQRDELREIIAAGAVAAGFENQQWTARRVAKIIAEKFGAMYHWKYIPQLLKAMKISYQTPDTRAKNHSTEAVDAWQQNEWPALKKKLKTKE